MTRLGRVQALKRVSPERASPRTLAALWHDDVETRLPAAERSRLHRAHAARAIRAATGGQCEAQYDDGAGRIAFLTEPVPGAPAEANDEIERLAAALRSATLVRVSCETGGFGLIAVNEHGWRAVDLFALDEAPRIEVRPVGHSPSAAR